jgi:hypothetical protein
LSADQENDQDLKSLNAVYEELSKDASVIARDLGESVSAYFILGFYLLAFAFVLDEYMLLSGGLNLSNIGSMAVLVLFGNVIPITAGCFVLYRYHRLNKRYGSLFSLEKRIRVQNYRKKRGTE